MNQHKHAANGKLKGLNTHVMHGKQSNILIDVTEQYRYCELTLWAVLPPASLSRSSNSKQTVLTHAVESSAGAACKLKVC